MHTITLEATNSAALTATTQITLEIKPDYDADGFPDDQEAGLGLNPLAQTDAYTDADDDGLTFIAELNRNTTPNNPDTDSDGRPDWQEVIDGSEPAVNDPPRTHVLSVWPLSMTFEFDLSQPGQLPQATVEAISTQPISATFTTSTPWIDLDSAGRQTPALTTVVINPSRLAEGTQVGAITVNSDLGSVTVLINVTATNKGDFCDANRDGSTNQADIGAVQSRVGAIIGAASYAVQYDVNRDGVIDAADVALISICMTTSFLNSMVNQLAWVSQGLLRPARPSAVRRWPTLLRNHWLTGIGRPSPRSPDLDCGGLAKSRAAGHSAPGRRG